MPGKVKVNGAWKDVPEVYTKVNGAWKTVAEAYTKVNGTWQQWFAPGGAVQLLQTIDLSTDTTSVTFDNINQSYTHLHMRGEIKGTGFSNNLQRLKLSFNDVDNNFGVARIEGRDGSSNSYIDQFASFTNLGFWGTQENPFSMDFYNYSNAAQKTRGLMRMANNAGEASAFSSFVFDTVEATNKISLVFSQGSIASGSTISLYGVGE